jgi:exonuclease SbcC
MHILKNITISNVRRFASDVSVPISRQATIFLAPNGTGKTALFEAIELALTGRVARLDKEIFALVKDGTSAASVELDFGKFQQKAIATLNGETQWSPSSELNGSTPVSDISYLLRLTHLLDQRDRDWFVQKEAKTAGNQLTKLPIGQEAQKLAELIPKLRNPIKRMLGDKQLDFDNNTTKLDEWDELIEKRKLAQELAGAQNLTLDVLVEALTPYLDNAPNIESIERLSSLHNICLSNNSDKLEKAKHLLIGLTSLEETCKKFTQSKTNQMSLVDKEAQLQDKKQSIKLINDNTLSQLLVIEKDISEIATTLNSRLLELRNIEKIKTYVEKEGETKDQVILKLETLKNLENATEEKSKEISKLNSDLIQHEQFDARVEDLKVRQQQLSYARDSLSLWSKQINSAKEVEKELPVIHADLEQLQKEIQRLEFEIEKVKKEAADTKIQLASLQKSSDQVRNAVAEIAANVAGKEGDCPVCGEQHGIKELEKRIKIKMEGLDPKLQLLVEKEAQLSQQETTLRVEFDSLIHKQNQLQNIISAKEATLKQSQLSIDNYRLNPLFESQDFEAAKKTLVKIDNALKNKEQQLTHDSLLLPEKPSVEELIEAKQSLEDLQSQRDDYRKFIFSAQEEIKDFQHTLEKLKADTREGTSKESVSHEIDKLRDLIEKKKSKKQELESCSESEKQSIQTIDNQISNIQIELKRKEAICHELIKMWRMQNLQGEPDLETLEHEIEKWQREIKELTTTIATLDEIRIKIAHYQGALTLKSVQQEIVKHTSGISENAHRINLINQITQSKQELDSIIEKEKALNTLSDELKGEIEQIQTRITSIQPLWQSLLARVVRESRFSHTALQFERKYNKPHATVNVPLSNLTVNASKVASEAQKTDLQLTFLLSMALTNPWSSWRALLLDDPTQHHDLVHASAIFDVLRDYILKYDFQLLMTTHDPVQANFFRRKLENDGIDVAIVNLVPHSDGVRAKENIYQTD